MELRKLKRKLVHTFIAKVRWACHYERYNANHKKKRANLRVIVSRTKTRMELVHRLMKEARDKS